MNEWQMIGLILVLFGGLLGIRSSINSLVEQKQEENKLRREALDLLRQRRVSDRGNILD
jgi:hypothetical protein